MKIILNLLLSLSIFLLQQTASAQNLIGSYTNGLQSEWSTVFNVTEGNEYRMVVSGQFSLGSMGLNCPNYDVDPAYWIPPYNEGNALTYACNEGWYIEDYCDGAFGMRPSPDVYNPDHSYDYYLTATSNTITVGFTDCCYDDNCGSITFELYTIPIPGCTDNAACNYNSEATDDDGSCDYDSCAGCTDSTACNYDAAATIDDGSCLQFDACGNCGGTATAGCTDSGACNYDITAGCDDSSCEYESCAGCTDPTACNYDATATIDDGLCGYPAEAYLDCEGECLNDSDLDGVCDELEVIGCVDPEACNYEPLATDAGDCDYLELYSIEGNVTPIIAETNTYTYQFTSGSTYQWTIENGSILNGNGTSEVEVEWDVLGAGQVCVIETNEAGCNGEAVCYDVTIILTDIHELNDRVISIFPNPASSMFTISIGEQLMNAYFCLYDNQNRIVHEGVLEKINTTIDTAEISDGKYMIKIAMDDIVVTRQLIIVK